MEQLIKDIFSFLEKQLLDIKHNIYLVGGSSRDYLLTLKFFDFDFAIDKKAIDIYKNFIDPNISFLKYGTIDLKYFNYPITITSFRKEISYLDHRHPQIEFTSDLNIDSIRRDFTINAIYIDKNLNIIDPQNGLKDLNERCIRLIGNIEKRIQEDPLRILRAYRFKDKLNFKIEKHLQTYIDENFSLLSLINFKKIEMELKKGSVNFQKEMLEKLKERGVLK